MRVRNRNIANVARGNRRFLSDVLRINLIGRGGHLHLFVHFLSVI